MVLYIEHFSLFRHVSLAKVDTVINDVLAATDLNFTPVKFSTESAARSVCEMNVVLDLELVKRINASKSLGVGYVTSYAHSLSFTFRLDETPHQRAGRSILEIHVFGQDIASSKTWCELVKGTSFIDISIMLYF
jgi:hypothetical protein